MFGDDVLDINDYKLIVKPLYGVDCQNMVIISEIEDIKNIKKAFPNKTEVLVQEFIQGINLSVSLISDGKNAIPISLNKQYITINKENQSYIGGELPYNHPKFELAFKIATKAVESIGGIKGFVGVDLIIKNDFIKRDNFIKEADNHIKGKDYIKKDDYFDNESIYFLEINSRFTTPYVGLSKIAKFNIGELIINLLDKKLKISEISKDNTQYKKYIGSNKFDKTVRFKKQGNELNIKIL
ncbi:hypothetical protein SDC9_34127 [bioreactor metagenome]|uniref:ATP-grasp domain-containing protein n=1 Tax=bioreactor metagenome TaxID=1076179 RepID=A0A644VBK0_9ZZZZ